MSWLGTGHLNEYVAGTGPCIMRVPATIVLRCMCIYMTRTFSCLGTYIYMRKRVFANILNTICAKQDSAGSYTDTHYSYNMIQTLSWLGTYITCINRILAGTLIHIHIYMTRTLSWHGTIHLNRIVAGTKVHTHEGSCHIFY